MADKDQAIHFCIGVLGGISSTLRGQSSDKCRKTSETIDLGIEGIRELVDSYDSTKENPCEGCTNRKGCITCENGELKETELSHSEVTKISDQEEPVSDVKTRVKEIFDSCEKIDISDVEKNRVAFGLLELEGFAKIFYEMGKQQEEPVSEE